MPDEPLLPETVVGTWLESAHERSKRCKDNTLVRILIEGFVAFEAGRIGEAAVWAICAHDMMTAIERAPDRWLAEKVRAGAKNRRDAKDKAEARDLAKGQWRKHRDDSVAAVIRSESISPFAERYSYKTVHGWIKDLKPGGTHRGRSGLPKKKK